LDESVRDALVGYTPPNKIIDPSFEVMFEDEPKFLGNHIMTLIILCDNDEFVRRRCGKKKRWRK